MRPNFQQLGNKQIILKETLYLSAGLVLLSG